MNVLNVIFTDPTKRLLTPVSLADAPEYFRANQTHLITFMDYEMNGETFRCFAKQWMVWNEKQQVWELAQIGSGAYGDQCVWRADA